VRSLPRLGCVGYLNAKPLIYGWPGQVQFDHPSRLCRDLANGELDVALVSSFEFLRNPIYSIIDEISIASDGPVYSVIVAHREPLEVVAEIAIDPASETSVNLLRALLAERGLTPQLVCEKASDSSRARLLIGDQAIRFREEHNDFAYWDLGDEWRHFCQRPFVYALWLIRPEFCSPREIAGELRAVRDRNLGRIDELIANEQRFDQRFCARYYRDHLRFTFGEREKEGLRTFQGLCARHQLLAGPQPQLTLV